MNGSENKTILRSTTQMIAKLNDMGVRYCHWKSNEHLLEGLTGDTDLDILVDKRDAAQFDAALSELHFVRISYPGGCIPGVDNWLGYVAGDPNYIHLHVHYDLVTGKKGVKEYHLPWANRVLASVEDSEYGFPVTAPSLELCLLVIRICLRVNPLTLLKGFLLRRGVVSQNMLREFDYLRQNTDQEEIARQLDDLGIEHTVKVRILEIVNSGKIECRQLKKLRRMLMGSLNHYRSCSSLTVWRRYISFRFRDARNALRERGSQGKMCCTIRRKIPCDGGSIITLIGADGSGKTSNLSMLYQWLRGKLEVKLVYAGSGNGSNELLQKLLGKIIAVYHKNTSCTQQNPGLLPDAPVKMRKARLKDRAKAQVLLSAAKSKLKIMKKACRLRAMGCIVLVDRYPQNQITGINDSPRIRAILRGVIADHSIEKAAQREEACFTEMTAIQPDVVIRLNVSPDVAKQRKPDHNLDYIRMKAETVSHLVFGSAKVYDIDADAPKEIVQDYIRSIIWENL